MNFRLHKTPNPRVLNGNYEASSRVYVYDYCHNGSFYFVAAYYRRHFRCNGAAHNIKFPRVSIGRFR